MRQTGEAWPTGQADFNQDVYTILLTLPRLFESGYEKLKYMKRFRLIAEELEVIVHAFVVMDNHVHWILTPPQSNSLAKLFQRLHTWWAMHYNKKYRRSGHLFESPYHSTPMSENHLWTAMRYVELNPRRAGLVHSPVGWKFSSARAHCSGRQGLSYVPLETEEWMARWGPQEWREFLQETQREFEAGLRKSLRCSRAYGPEWWIEQLTREYGIYAGARGPGRPRKKDPTVAGMTTATVASSPPGLTAAGATG
jgi:putative transposase